MLISIKKPFLLHLPVTKEGAGAVDEDDFIKAFEDVPTVQVNIGMLKTHVVKDKRGVSVGHTLNSATVCLKIHYKLSQKDKMYSFITGTTVATSTCWRLFKRLDYSPHCGHRNWPFVLV